MEACGRPSLIKIQRDSATSPTQRLANMADPMIGGKAGVRNRFGFSVLSHLPLTQPCKAGSPQTLAGQSTREQENEDSARRGSIIDKDRQKVVAGSGMIEVNANIGIAFDVGWERRRLPTKGRKCF